MRFSFWLPANETWSQMAARARRLAAEGWQGLWLADNLLPRPPSDGDLLEVWTALGALAASVDGLRLGSLVSSNTYRHPTLLAKMASSVDGIAGGRLTLGVGTGWRPRDHEAFGIPLPEKDVRLAMLEEACEILRPLLEGQTVTHEGAHYRVRELRLNPAPAWRIPLLIGARRSALVARFADAWHLFDPPDGIRRRRAQLARACERLGRDPGDVAILATPLLLCTDDRRLIEDVRARPGGSQVPIVSADEVVDRVGRYAEAGVDEIVLPSMGVGPAEVDAVSRFAEAVFPVFRELR